MKTCIILCGGQSKRMGKDKGSLLIQNKPMIKYILSTLNDEIDEAIIVLNDCKRINEYSEFINPNDYNYKLKFVQDEIKNKGPMSGILTGLNNISSEYSLVLPCDNPFIGKTTIKKLFDEIDGKYQAIVPYHNPENIIKTTEPLHAIYRKDITEIINELISNNELHIKGLIEKIDTNFVLIDNKKILKKEFRNLNYPKDLKMFH